MLLTTPQFEFLQSCVQEKAGVILPYSCMPHASLRLMPILSEYTLKDFDSLIALLNAPATKRKREKRVIERLIAPQAFFFEQYDTFKTIRHRSIPVPSPLLERIHGARAGAYDGVARLLSLRAASLVTSLLRVASALFRHPVEDGAHLAH